MITLVRNTVSYKRLLCAIVCLWMIFVYPAHADMLIDRGYDIPRTPRDDEGMEYYHPVVQMKLGTAFGSLDEPIIILDIKNTSSSAICLPLFYIPNRGGREHDIMIVVDVETDALLPLKGKENRTDYALDRTKILPPGYAVRYIHGLYQRFDLTRGRTYKVKYDIEAFYCDAFERGLPAADLLYKFLKQQESGLRVFERSPRTTVKLRSELTFTLE